MTLAELAYLPAIFQGLITMRQFFMKKVTVRCPEWWPFRLLPGSARAQRDE
jgi:hypothetical protein